MTTIDQPGAVVHHSPAVYPLRLGCVSYLNTLPLIEGLGKLRDFRLTLTAPAHLIDLLLDDRIDLGLVSLIDYQRAPADTPLVMLPVGMIGCDGPTLTVRLFSSVPPERITEVHADADSHTSTVLLSVLLAEMHGVRPRIRPFDAHAHRAERASRPGSSHDQAWPGAILVIGDKVVSDAPPMERYPYQLDLGEAWKKLTGLPFVYAAWMCRQERANDPRLISAAAVLDRQRRHNATRLGWIVETRASARSWPPQLAEEYLGKLLRFEVTEAHKHGVERFFDLAAQHGLIEAREPVRWSTIA